MKAIKRVIREIREIRVIRAIRAVHTCEWGEEVLVSQGYHELRSLSIDSHVLPSRLE